MAPQRSEKRIRDWNAFLLQPDPKVTTNKVGSTKERIKGIHHNFQKWVQELPNKDYKYWLENITLRAIQGFFEWYLDEHNINYRSSFMTIVRFFRIYWMDERGVCLPYQLGKDISSLAQSMAIEYELDKTAKEQPPFSINEVFVVTRHLVAACDIAFPTFRVLFQLNTLRKMMVSTSARPGTLVLSSCYKEENDALKWKDIDLYMVKHPEYSNAQVLLMRARHRLNKGKRNQGAPPTFTYTERNDNLGLCVIQDILMYAFLDDAFASQHIKCPRDIWRFTTVPDHRHSTPIHFKDIGFSYTQAQEYEKKASTQAGFPDEGSLYKYRKGAAENLRNLDEHSRNIIMGHRKSATFSNYMSVFNDTQSIFMQTPTRDSLLNLACHGNLTRDASAPLHLNDEQKESIEMDTELQDLKRAAKSSKDELISEFHKLNKAEEASDPRFRELKRLQQEIRTRRKKLVRQAQKAARKEFFDSIGNQIIEQNHHGTPITFTPDVSHIQPERIALAELEFKNRDVDTIDDTELIEDRIRSLELRLKLNSLHMPKALKNRVVFKDGLKGELKEVVVPTESSSGLECPVCLGSTGLDPNARRYKYSRKDVLQAHFKTHRLPFIFEKRGRKCDWPGCPEVFFTLARYKLHLANIHKIPL
ncbi:FluG domain protein [Penicillium verhagenii]|uniref:FluG domain protein n=1 Tax=Penicillium verhagenii TaxID=1562060 RepID=UPI002545B23A|nr:FluG domain protein [Penicillium verhagenii]KAJ5928363.1 FluG domain protein [Penicillium verhagenii]